jgi:DNA-directed RNA polymerase specialized sigma24 family protein
VTGTGDEPAEVLRADAELCARLRAVGCTGPLWERAAVEFARYGWSVLSAWIGSRLIMQKCREKGRAVELPGHLSAEDHEDLVAASVAYGLEKFRRSLADGRWRPERGASLRTYFLGSCVLAFPNVFRTWHNDRRRYVDGATAWASEPAASRPGTEPVDLVDAVAALESLTRDESERDRALRRLRFLDYTRTEIADILGMSPGAVGTALHRIQRRDFDLGEERQA